MTESPSKVAARSALGRVYGNAGKLLGGKAAAGLISIVYLALATRSLGPAQYGVLVLIGFYTTLVGNFFVVQGWHALVRYGSAQQVSEDPAVFQRLFVFIAGLELASGVVAIGIVAALSNFAGLWFGWPPEYNHWAALYSLAVFANMHNAATGALNLLGRFDLLSGQQVFGPLVRLLGALIALWADAGLRGFLIAWLAGSMMEGAIDWWLLLREFDRRKLSANLWRWPRGVVAENPGLTRFLLTRNIDGIFSDIGNRITPLIVGAVLNPAAVGLYHLALRIGMVLQQPIAILSRTVYQELALFSARGDLAAVRHLVWRTGLISMACGLLVFLVFLVFGGALLRLIGGPGFEGAYPILLMTGLASSVSLFGFSFSAALVALGRPYLTLWINLGVTVLMLPVLYLLLHRFGVAGAGMYAVAYAVLGVAAFVFMLLTHKADRQ